jgi:hypothetical protein
MSKDTLRSVSYVNYFVVFFAIAVSQSCQCLCCIGFAAKNLLLHGEQGIAFRLTAYRIRRLDTVRIVPDVK